MPKTQVQAQGFVPKTDDGKKVFRFLDCVARCWIHCGDDIKTRAKVEQCRTGSQTIYGEKITIIRFGVLCWFCSICMLHGSGCVMEPGC